MQKTTNEANNTYVPIVQNYLRVCLVNSLRTTEAFAKFNSSTTKEQFLGTY